MTVKIFKAKEQTYLDQATVKTFTVWHPMVKFDNQWCYLPDITTRSGLVEAVDEMEATEKAIKALRELKELIGNNRPSGPVNLVNL